MDCLSPGKRRKTCFKVILISLFIFLCILLVFQLQGLAPRIIFFNSLIPTQCTVHSQDYIVYFAEIEKRYLLIFNVNTPKLTINFNSGFESDLKSNFEKYKIGGSYKCYTDPTVEAKVLFSKPSMWASIVFTAVLCILLFVFCILVIPYVCGLGKTQRERIMQIVVRLVQKCKFYTGAV